jgi:hypothetical protein
LFIYYLRSRITAMTNAITPKETFFELLESAEKARNAEILQSAHAATDFDRQVDEETDWKGLVVTEAARLADKVDFVGRHPKLPKFLGGSAIGVHKLERRREPDYITDPMLATEAEYLGDYALRSYFQFEVEHYNFGRDISLLRIIGVSEEIHSGHKKTDELYRVTADPTEHRNFWKVEGTEFRAFRDKKLREIGLEYKRENPWFDKYYVFRSENWRIVKNASPQKSEDDFAVLTEVVEERKIQEELIPKLEPGPDTWQYPDELYHFPLGLLMQANEVFGTKQR